MRIIKLDQNNRVIAWRIGYTIADGEIVSEIGEIGETMQADGTFKVEVALESPSAEERLSALESAVLELMGV
jgi:formylmethanofuran dehydrogenase subunit A